MPLELQPLTKEDAAEATRLVIASYENNPFRRIIFPSGMLKASIDKIEKSKYDAVEDPDQYPWKVIDTDTGEMAACATWAYTNAMSDEDWDRAREEVVNGWPDARHEILDPFLYREQDIKRRIMGHTRWWELIALSTLPRYQRRGIGSMLVKWGTERLEEMKVPGFIISTDQGYGLYVKHGFREVERWEVDLGRWAQLGGSGPYKNVYLTRIPLDTPLPQTPENE